MNEEKSIENINRNDNMHYYILKESIKKIKNSLNKLNQKTEYYKILNFLGEQNINEKNKNNDINIDNSNIILNKDIFNNNKLDINMNNLNIINHNKENSLINNKYINNLEQNDHSEIIYSINEEFNNIDFDNTLYEYDSKKNIITKKYNEEKINNNSLLGHKHLFLENNFYSFENDKIKQIEKEEEKKILLKTKNINEELVNTNPFYFQKYQVEDNEEDEKNEVNINEGNKYKEENVDIIYDIDNEKHNINTKNEYLFKTSRIRKKVNDINNNENNLKINKNENSLYDELYELINKYSFDTILDYTLKYYNGKFNLNETDIKDLKLFKKINDIEIKINKDIINFLLIKILSNKYEEYESKLIDLITIPKSNEKIIDIKDNNISINTNINLISKNINSEIFKTEIVQLKKSNSESLIKKENIISKSGIICENKRKRLKNPSPDFYYWKHFFKNNDKIYCYTPKKKLSYFQYYTFYCIKRRSQYKCQAKIRIKENDTNPVFIGEHVSHPCLTIEEFNKKYPDLQNKEWTHAQFAVKNKKLFVISHY